VISAFDLKRAMAAELIHTGVDKSAFLMYMYLAYRFSPYRMHQEESGPSLRRTFSNIDKDVP
jgi:hypothetical protein